MVRQKDHRADRVKEKAKTLENYLRRWGGGGGGRLFLRTATPNIE